MFLDEITEMPLEMQVRLLRVLETGSFCRVGGDQEIRAGARIMAATNRDPATAVADNRLREDLMYRLAVFPINLPPLRTRGEDVELLARHFLSDLNHEAGSDKVFSSASLELLRTHPWPGNVRELKNCVQRAFILADEEVQLKELAPAVRSALAEHGCLKFSIGTSLAAMERKTIFATLEHCSGNKRRAAEVLGVSLKTLYNRLAEYSAHSAELASQSQLPSVLTAEARDGTPPRPTVRRLAYRRRCWPDAITSKTEHGASALERCDHLRSGARSGRALSSGRSQGVRVLHARQARPLAGGLQAL